MLGNITKVAFILSHAQQLKFYLPIAQSLDVRSNIELTFIDTTSKENPKLSQKENPKVSQKIKSINPTCIINYIFVNKSGNLVEKIKSQGIKLLLLENISDISLKDEIPSLKIFYLQHSHDIVSVIPKRLSFQSIMKIDKFLLFSPYWSHQFTKKCFEEFKLRKEELEQLKEKVCHIGFPELDQIKSFTKEYIKNKYNINTAAKKIIFFDPMGNVNHVGNAYYGYFFKLKGNFISKLNIFLRQFLYDLINNPLKIPKIIFMILKIYRSNKTRINYESFFKDLRKFCNQKGYFLVVKSRPKNNDPDFIEKNSDLYTFDLDYYPFTLLELLFISDYYIGFNSTAIIEAIFCNCRATQINICPSEFQYSAYGGGIYSYLEKQLSTKKSWNNYPGLIKVKETTDKFDDIASDLGLSIDKSIQNEYIRKFIFESDGKSSERVLREINS